MEINLNLTLLEKESIALRADENGFDTISSYIKVVGLKSPVHEIKPIEAIGLASIEVSIEVTAEQKEIIEKKAKESNCDDINTYLKFMALNALFMLTVEVRSSGKLDDMLSRIANQKGK
ncbi:hypothetical protein GJV85_03790 [Sulfurimonas aquatica]|uniref:Uncharacterized protein n=1 Tax=Sulfurimonas aquatica TaxID=2672570 RepID=A0A975AZ50_9BACT|nr:hypothetical protein [Sulfurimonas aquatica]QSZ41267.1 hypothetical protein GJV85_03790 [Sulfurimonas aquatica]